MFPRTLRSTPIVKADLGRHSKRRNLHAQFKNGGELLKINTIKKGSNSMESGCVEHPAFQVRNAQSFLMDRDRYDFVGNATKYIGELLLVGTYADDRGNNYSFSKNGLAVFPDKKFKFQLILDQIDPFTHGFDGFYDETAKDGTSYAFKRNINALTLYSVIVAQDKESAAPDYAHPIATLHCISK